MKLLSLQIAAAIVLLMSSGCEVHRDASKNPTHWTHIEKGGQYETLRPVIGHSRFYSDYRKGRQDLDLVCGVPRRNDADTKAVPVGTILEAQNVYLDSSPLQYSFLSYIGIVRGGPLDGLRVDFTSLLNNTYSGFRPDRCILKPLQD